jgi:hypothetical protein
VGPGSIVTIADAALLAVMALYFASLVRPWPIHGRGPVIRREAVTLLGRLRMLGRPLLLLVALAVVGWRLGHASVWAVAAVVVGAVALLAAPVSYTLTPEGIRLGRLPLRRWTEFAGVARRRWSVRLQGVGARGMTVWLSGDREDDEFVLLLRQLVRGSYQGWIDPEANDAGDLGPDAARGILARQAPFPPAPATVRP